MCGKIWLAVESKQPVAVDGDMGTPVMATDTPELEG